MMGGSCYIMVYVAVAILLFFQRPLLSMTSSKDMMKFLEKVSKKFLTLGSADHFSANVLMGLLLSCLVALVSFGCLNHFVNNGSFKFLLDRENFQQIKNLTFIY
jgi:hypothetical protein